MENVFQAGELTVIAGRPGAGKTTLLRNLVNKYGLTDPLLLNFEEGADFFDLFQTVAANKRYKCIMVEDIPTKQEELTQKNLQTLKQLALNNHVAVIATLTLNRNYLKNGTLDHGAVKTDLRKSADRLLVVDRPPDMACRGANTIIRIYDKDQALSVCCNWHPHGN